MKDNDTEMLLRVLSEVFEGFAFMFVEPDTDAGGEEAGEWIRARIGYKGPDTEGFFEIVSPVDFCDELAENILGDELGDLPPDAGESALKEVVNVACGYLLAEKFGTEMVFDLSMPQAEAVEDGQIPVFYREGRHWVFLVDETPILVRFHSGR